MDNDRYNYLANELVKKYGWKYEKGFVMCHYTELNECDSIEEAKNHYNYCDDEGFVRMDYSLSDLEELYANM